MRLPSRLGASIFVVQVLISAAGSALWALLSWMPNLSNRHGKLVFSSKLTISLWAYILSHVLLALIMLLVVSIVIAWQHKRIVSSRQGREKAMTDNLDLLLSRHEENPETSRILSTRFMSWAITETSAIRKSFRQELDNAIQNENREVRRVWIIRNSDDANRLLAYMNLYRGHTNHSIRVFFDEPLYLPEVLVINSRRASLSFPQPRNPMELDACIVMTDHQAVLVIERYFETLWEEAKKIFENGEPIDGEALEMLNRKAQHPVAT